MSQKTIDVASSLCVVLLALDEPMAAQCVQLLRPLHLIRSTAADAAIVIPRHQPLVVVVGETLSPSETTVVREVSSACGAELVFVRSGMPADELNRQLMAALRVAEKRRLMG